MEKFNCVYCSEKVAIQISSQYKIVSIQVRCRNCFITEQINQFMKSQKIQDYAIYHHKRFNVNSFRDFCFYCDKRHEKKRSVEPEYLSSYYAQSHKLDIIIKHHDFTFRSICDA